MTTIHTRQLQQYTQDNCNNTNKTTAKIQTRQLQQYKQDNYNNTNKTTTTIHTRQLQQYTQENYNNTHKTTNNNYTQDKLKLATIHRRHISNNKNIIFHSRIYLFPNDCTYII